MEEGLAELTSPDKSKSLLSVVSPYRQRSPNENTDEGKCLSRSF